MHFIVWTLHLCEINYGSPFLCPILSQRQFFGGLYGVLPNYNLIFKFLVTPIVKRQETSSILKVKTSIWEVSKVSIIFPLFGRPIKVSNCEKKIEL
jgi:hypothetical protein